MTKRTFATRVKHHTSRLGLSMWKVDVEVVSKFEFDGEQDPSVHGLLEFDRASMTATVFALKGLSDDDMESVALHESLHLLLAEYRHLCSSLIENLDENGKTAMYRMLQDIDERTVIAVERSLQ